MIYTFSMACFRSEIRSSLFSRPQDKRIKSASDVLSAGQEIDVKVIGIKDGKISLSMKALLEPEEEVIEEVEIPEAENIGTSLGDLFKNIKL